MYITKKRIIALITTAMVLLTTLLPAMTVSAATDPADVYGISKLIDSLYKTTSIEANFTYSSTPPYGSTTVEFTTSGAPITVGTVTATSAEELATTGITVPLNGIDVVVKLPLSTIGILAGLETSLPEALAGATGDGGEAYNAIVAGANDPIVYLAIYQGVQAYIYGLPAVQQTAARAYLPDLSRMPETPTTLSIISIGGTSVTASVSATIDITPTENHTSGTDVYAVEITAANITNSGNLLVSFTFNGVTDLESSTKFIAEAPGYNFDGYFADPGYSLKLGDSLGEIHYLSDTTVYAKYTAIPGYTAPPRNDSGPSDKNMVYQPITTVTKPDATTPDATTPAATPDTTTGNAGTSETPASTPASTPAADVVVDSEITEDGTMTLTVGGTAIETSSTSAATVIAAGEASEVITSGNAVAVVTTDGAVIAGANASGSMNSASTIAALNAAAADAAEGDTVVIAAGDDVSVISAATLRKLAAAAEAAGVEASVTAAATDESGVEIATIDIPLSDKTKTSIKTGLILVDETIDTAVAEREAASGVTVLASFKTEQKTSFGVAVTFSFDTETLGLDDAAEGDTYYVAILRGDGKTVQVKATIVDGKLVYTTASAGVMMISNEKFTK
jgi:hypothetical protein